MNRFRVWTGKEYRFPPSMDEWDDEDCSFFADYNPGLPENFESHTGLYDRNGKDIYEGDIVRFLTAMKYSGSRGDIGVIQSDLVELGYLVMNTYPLSRLTMPRAKNMEVIGNIRQNKDLLK